MKLLEKFELAFNGIRDFLGYVAAGVFVLMMVFIVVGVAMRYIFGKSILGMTEVSGYALTFATFWGSAWLLKSDGHVRMDVVITRMSPRPRAVLNLVSSIIGTLTCLIILWYGAKTTWETFLDKSASQQELGVPMFILLSAIPTGFCLLFFQFLASTWALFKGMKNEKALPRTEGKIL